MVLLIRLFIQTLILLSAFVETCLAANDIAVNFTKVPKNTEFFVGTEAILQWEYSSGLPADPVRKIKFGIQENENTDVAIFVKNVSQGNVKTNTKVRLDVIAPLNGRVHVIENRTATFRIANLTLNDSKRYFCTLEVDSDSPWTKTHYVDVRVVDLMIDDQKSTRVVESWEGHKITLQCVVKKVLHDAPVRFYWLQQNRTLPGPQTSWKTLGQVSLVTVNDQDFEPVTCVAETEATTQRMEINIKQLYKPLEPVNLTVQEIQRNDTECKLYNKITWEPPQDDGGIPLTGYLLEFKHPVVNSISHSRININTTEHMVCKLQISGHPRELKVDVRGINKAGRGFRSNSIKVLFFSTPSAPYNLKSSLLRKENPPFAVKLSWNQPNENGGMPVLEYSLEYKVHGLPWEDGEMRETNDRHMLVYKYEESYKYEVRVRARNIFGFGPQSTVKVVYFAEKPGPPQNLKRGLVFYENSKTVKLELFWMPPKSSGGMVVSNYIVEHKTVKTEWSSANNESVNGTRFALPMKESETYIVRVRAVNSLGLSEPSNVITIKLTESDVKSPASSNSSGSVRATYLFEGYLLLLTVFEAFALKT